MGVHGKPPVFKVTMQQQLASKVGSHQAIRHSCLCVGLQSAIRPGIVPRYRPASSAKMQRQHKVQALRTFSGLFTAARLFPFWVLTSGCNAHGLDCLFWQQTAFLCQSCIAIYACNP
jgi:hypothetical protein